MHIRRTLGSVVCAALALGGVQAALASDHGDAPVSGGLARQDANITDFHMFVKGRNLVLVVSTNPSIPPTANDYFFPTDVSFSVHIDNTSLVADGVVQDPAKIRNNITFRVDFRTDGSVNVRRFDNGLEHDPQLVNVFAGLRDDPFIRAPRQGRNIAAIVLETPLSAVAADQGAIIAWANSRVKEFSGDRHESAAKPLYTMFPEAAALNMSPPWEQGPRPDVLILDTSKDTAFPNGRALEDDVVDLMCQLEGECRVFNQPNEGANGPTQNDAPFMSAFPYLAPPHAAPAL